jgi:hypothetical protein
MSNSRNWFTNGNGHECNVEEQRNVDSKVYLSRVPGLPRSEMNARQPQPISKFTRIELLVERRLTVQFTPLQTQKAYPPFATGKFALKGNELGGSHLLQHETRTGRWGGSPNETYQVHVQLPDSERQMIWRFYWRRESDETHVPSGKQRIPNSHDIARPYVLVVTIATQITSPNLGGRPILRFYV